MVSRSRICIQLLLIAALLVSGCSVNRRGEPVPPTANALSLVTPTFTPFQPLPNTEQGPAAEPSPTALSVPTTVSAITVEPEPSPSATAAPTAPVVQPTTASGSSGERPLVWVDPALPARLQSALVSGDERLAFTGDPALSQAAALRLGVGGSQVASRWVYALVAPFPSLVQGVALQDVQSSWRGEPAGPFAGRPLWMDESTLGIFTGLWGPPAPGMVRLASGDMLGEAWAERPAWGIITFEGLNPGWKVLEVDGASPLRKEFDPETYGLTVPVTVDGDPAVQELLAVYLPAANRDPARLTVLAMTGVTALVRATAHTMEQQGIDYPGKDVGAWLREADLTHISNEIPFAENCPFPDPVQADLRFCSDPRYIQLLEEMGTDIVELTGDHFQDWGQAAMLYTLDLYRERGWKYYGGGANLDEGRQALLVEHNGNRLAFIGCNAKGGGFAQAGPDRPGAVTCDLDWMAAEITRLREEGYLPIATFQHFEYYTYRAQPNQIRDARQLAQAGAIIVSGSQAHQPQGMEFFQDAFIHYGLGNLFFDQYSVSEACRQAFIDRHVFYEGRYIGTELLPILFIDYARPRPMTPEERENLLQTVFSASDW